MARKRSPKPQPTPAWEPQRPVSPEALEKSTQLVRNMGTVFAVPLIYLFVSTAFITDLHLVELHKTMELPLMSLNMPFSLTGFAYGAPVIILVGHLLFLLALREHAVKLKAWIGSHPKETNVETLRRDLPYSLFNLAYLHNGWTALPAKAVVHFAAFLAPAMTLAYLQLRFSDLHELSLTTTQCIFFIMDSIMVACFYRSISRVPAANGNQRRLALGVTAAAMSALAIASLADLAVVKLIAGDNTYKSVAAYMQGESLETIILLARDNRFHQAYDARFYTHPEYFLPVPRLEVRNKKINMNDPGDRDSVYCACNNDPFRDFVFARFNACVFVRAKLSRARMMSADLEGCTMALALLHQANLAGSNLKRASLRGANLSSADLHEADFQDADLTSAQLIRATLTSTDLRRAILVAANMSDETHLTGKLMRGANMECANLQNAHIDGAYLECVNLQHADLKGTIIIYSNLQGADMQGANLQGASFGGVHMQGADLSNCQMLGTLFEKCHVNSVNWPVDVCDARATIFDIGVKEFPAGKQLDKTHRELTAINITIDFRERMQYAKKNFEPHFVYSTGIDPSPGQFTEERINLLDQCNARVDHLWLQASVLPLEMVMAHNRAITHHTLKNYPHRIARLLQYNLDRFPGAKPESSKLPFAPIR